jgi:hypothetical protein
MEGIVLEPGLEEFGTYPGNELMMLIFLFLQFFIVVSFCLLSIKFSLLFLTDSIRLSMAFCTSFFTKLSTSMSGFGSNVSSEAIELSRSNCLGTCGASTPRLQKNTLPLASTPGTPTFVHKFSAASNSWRMLRVTLGIPVSVIAFACNFSAVIMMELQSVLSAMFKSRLSLDKIHKN